MKNIRPNIIPQNGWITLCNFCGEQIGNSQKFCKQCKTQKGRKEIFDANIVVAEENKKLGYNIPESFKNWR